MASTTVKMRENRQNGQRAAPFRNPDNGGLGRAKKEAHFFTLNTLLVSERILESVDKFDKNVC